MTQPGRTRWTWAGAAWLLLPAGVWLVAMLWLGGDLGRSTDDYSVNMRDPATGELPSPFNPWSRYPFFWRPLHNAMCFGAGTLFSQNWRVLIIFCAVMHAAACAAMYALLRTGTRSRGPAAVGALVLLVHPMNFEVAFWFCSISAAISTALWCLMAVWCIGLIRRTQRPRAIELVGLAAMALTVPCFYEQPATGVIALPLILLAAWLTSPSGPRLWPAFWREILLCTVVGSMCVVYVLLLRLTAPSTFRGGADSFVTSAGLSARITEVAKSIRWQLYGSRLQHTVSGSWDVGIRTLSTPVGIAAIAALAVLLVVWAWAWWTETGAETDAEPPAAAAATLPHRAASRACWLAAGILLFTCAFIPIALMGRQNVEPRTLYFPLLGLSMILSQALDALLSALPIAGRWQLLGRSVRSALALTAGAAVIAGAVCCVGIQTWCKLRSDRDEAIAARLKKLVPDPPPNAAYLPLRLDAGPTSTGYLLFDRLRPAAFATTWSATALMREATRRADVTSASINPWTTLPYEKFTTEGLVSTIRLNSLAADQRGRGEFVAWTRAIPFTIDDDGRVRLVRQIDVERSDERVEALAMPVVKAAVRSGDARGQARVFAMIDPADPPATYATGWRWSSAKDRTAPIAPQALTSRGTTRQGTWLHPTYQDRSRAEMLTTIDPAPRERRLRFRITTPPEDYERFAGAEPVTVQIELFHDSDAGVNAGSPVSTAIIELTRELAESEARWVPVELPVPATDVPLLLRVRVIGSKARGAMHAPVWVTPGMWIPPLATLAPAKAGAAVESAPDAAEP